MWCDHPFSQRNRMTERIVVSRVWSDRKVRGGGGWSGGQNLKKGERGRQYMGGLHKIGA